MQDHRISKTIRLLVGLV